MEERTELNFRLEPEQLSGGTIDLDGNNRWKNAFGGGNQELVLDLSSYQLHCKTLLPVSDFLKGTVYARFFLSLSYST